MDAVGFCGLSAYTLTTARVGQFLTGKLGQFFSGGNRDPYTKRLLPDFLIPRCAIRLDYLMEAARQARPVGNTEQACDLLGCVDARSAETHLRRLEAAAARATMCLAERRAMTLELGDLPDTSPDSVPLARLDALYRQEIEDSLRAGTGISPISVRQILQAELWKQPGKKPSTFICLEPRPP